MSATPLHLHKCVARFVSAAEFLVVTSHASMAHNKHDLDLINWTVNSIYPLLPIPPHHMIQYMHLVSFAIKMAHCYI